LPKGTEENHSKISVTLEPYIEISFRVNVMLLMLNTMSETRIGMWGSVVEDIHYTQLTTTPQGLGG
jgi:hypothetical protein